MFKLRLLGHLLISRYFPIKCFVIFPILISKYSDVENEYNL